MSHGTDLIENGDKKRVNGLVEKKKRQTNEEPHATSGSAHETTPPPEKEKKRGFFSKLFGRNKKKKNKEVKEKEKKPRHHRSATLPVNSLRAGSLHGGGGGGERERDGDVSGGGGIFSFLAKGKINNEGNQLENDPNKIKFKKSEKEQGLATVLSLIGGVKSDLEMNENGERERDEVVVEEQQNYVTYRGNVPKPHLLQRVFRRSSSSPVVNEPYVRKERRRSMLAMRERERENGDEIQEEEESKEEREREKREEERERKNHGRSLSGTSSETTGLKGLNNPHYIRRLSAVTHSTNHLSLSLSHSSTGGGQREREREREEEEENSNKIQFSTFDGELMGPDIDMDM